ncbi:MAG: ADP-ribosylglycohydrolase family protein [Candidatus Kapabacteria bacterium]|nr:ADP-ribosylglycohydrolase family protein [Candidatus Kapabacteria bacterium]
MDRKKDQQRLSKIQGCLIGGAIGDALGATIEFDSINQVLARYGKEGITDFVNKYGTAGIFTDDTQMSLFSCEGILNYFNSDHSFVNIDDLVIEIWKSYKNWYITQSVPFSANDKDKYDSRLMKFENLFANRAPGGTCLSSLQSGKFGTMDDQINNSKGCGTVMRIAPAGFIENIDNFELGCKIGALTHGHPTGYLASGCLAQIISYISHGDSILNSIKKSIKILKKYEYHEQTLEAVEKAVDFYKLGLTPNYQIVEMLGGGWIAEEALSIALYCALDYQEDFQKALILSVNHSGDSDSTGAITGNILGTYIGIEAIPKKWIDEVEMSSEILEMAVGLYSLLK